MGELELLEGSIERIVFYSPDTGYTVCKFSLPDDQTINVVGAFPPLSAGELLRVKGKWEINPKFGKQFKVESFLPILPSSVKGIEKFLSSGLIWGVGPVIARSIIQKFGERTIDILTNNPEKLKEIEGIGPVKLREIKKSWSEHEDIRELIIFLQENNMSFRLGENIMYTRLVEGQFPDYQQVVPKKSERLAVMDGTSLHAALRRVSIVSSERTRGVKLLLEDRKLEVSSINPDVGEASEEIEVEYDAAPLGIGFNARYLMEMLSVLPSDARVEIGLNDDVSPGVMRVVGDPDYCYIVMPMRL